MKFIGAILAGGKSHRMGQDKALLSIGDISLLKFMQNKLVATKIFDEIIICRDQALSTGPHKYLSDIHPELGPIGALYTLGINYPNHRAFILPVDMPLMEAALIRKLCSAAENSRVAVYFAQYNLPVSLFFDESTNAHLKERINKSNADLSLNQLLCDINARQLASPSDSAPFTNINTLQDWQGICDKTLNQ